MRSRKHLIVSSSDLHQWALQWLLKAELLRKRDGCSYGVDVVWSIVLRAAARMISVFAACRDLSEGPSEQTIFNALSDGLPRTLAVLEKRLHTALGTPWMSGTSRAARVLRRRSWQMAVDWHLVPYYGEPCWSRNEVCRGQRQKGTTHFHVYASVCVVQYGQRYTLALTWVRRHESKTTVLRRLLGRVRECGVKIKVLLLDRAFFSAPVIALLQQSSVPFVMPVVISGARPRRARRTAKRRKSAEGRATKGLRWIKRQKAGWYRHTMKRGQETATFNVCVSYRTYRHRRTGKRGQQKLLFAAWRVRGVPTDLRERYRKRFGIETSYRQMRQARIYTCTPNPHLRLLFAAISLLLRNLWVWVHATLLAEGRDETMTLHLEQLRFKQLLDWIAQAVTAQLHDGTMPCVSMNE
jgi:putative transposase